MFLKVCDSGMKKFTSQPDTGQYQIVVQYKYFLHSGFQNQSTDFQARLSFCGCDPVTSWIILGKRHHAHKCKKNYENICGLLLLFFGGYLSEEGQVRIPQFLLRLLRTKPNRKYQSVARNSWCFTHILDLNRSYRNLVLRFTSHLKRKFSFTQLID